VFLALAELFFDQQKCTNYPPQARPFSVHSHNLMRIFLS